MFPPLKVIWIYSFEKLQEAVERGYVCRSNNSGMYLCYAEDAEDLSVSPAQIYSATGLLTGGNFEESHTYHYRWMGRAQDDDCKNADGSSYLNLPNSRL